MLSTSASPDHEPSFGIYIETRPTTGARVGWGSHLAFRIIVDNVERKPLTEWESDYLGGLLRHVGRLLRERKPAHELRAAVAEVEIAERALRLAKDELHKLLQTVIDREGVHACASKSGLREDQVKRLSRK